MSNLMMTKNGRVVKPSQFGLGKSSAWNSFIDELFNDDLNAIKNTSFNHGVSSPKVNVIETDESYTLKMAIPGFTKSDFVIDLENEHLSISMDLKENDKKEDLNYTRKEFGYGSFKRSFVLPDTVEGEKIEASYKEGILGLTIPKKEEAKPKPARVIEIS